MDNKRIGSFIKELREKEGLSQGALAKKVFVASSVVSRWESGVAGVSANNLVLLSEIFHVSLDELVAGHRFTEDNQEEKEEVLLEVLNSHQKKSRYIKRLLHIIVVLLILFLGYFFYNFYNSVKVYTIHTDTDKLNITYGMLTKTRDRIYFHLDVDSNINDDDIENVSIYYELEDERKDIIKCNTLTSFNFIDYYGYEEYINFNNFDKIINNMYFEIVYYNSDVEKYKLTFDRNYANIDFFLKNDKKIEKSVSDNNTELSNSSLDEKIQKVKEILSKSNDEKIITYENVDYDVLIFSNRIKIIFNESGFKNQFIYNFDKVNFFSFENYINDEWKSVYMKSIHSGECIEGDCKNFNVHYEKFKKVLDYIIEKNN